ncbi:hypothetical protein R1sor_014534 [Riccia sorocarpa]|uniref:Uncharacterized protein n=1 Tax=Riccia sorocarpa TaxID=122646 RepID=A0ABD3HCU6_9MARC
MFERALSLRRKILRALKAQFRLEKSSSLARKPGAVISNSRSEMDILGLGPSDDDDGVPQVKYSSQRPLDVVSSEEVIHDPAAPAIDAIPVRGLRSKIPLSVVVPPKPPVPIAAQTPLDTPVCGSSRSADVSRPNPSPARSQEFAAHVEGFQQVQRQLHRRAITRVRSMPVTSNDPLADPMRKLRDSYLRIMHKMAQEEAKMNPLSPATVSTVEKDHSRLFDYLYRRRTPADDEEEEFCRLAVMKTKFNRSQSPDVYFSAVSAWIGLLNTGLKINHWLLVARLYIAV